MEAYPVHNVTITRIKNGKAEETADLLAVEEPLEIRMYFGPENDRKEQRLAVTMRTVGNDFELVAGFLFTEGIINAYHQITQIRYCTELNSPEEEGNVVIVHLSTDLKIDPTKLQRHFYTTSSCGVCGKTSIEAIHQQSCAVMPEGSPVVAAEIIHSLPVTLREDQTVFKHTGGLHAAALFTKEGKLLMVREDIGRHNAVDKLIGAILAKDEPLFANSILLVSGRAGFELVQKAIVAGIPIMAAVGAPSSLAAKLAADFGQTLCGFVRNGRFNIYSGASRIQQD